MTPEETNARFLARMAEWRKPFTGFPAFAKDCLKIQNKEGKIVPFELNDAQWFLHEKLETQLQAQGMVRATGLKGRRQGFCLDPNTRILTADLRWVPIKDLQEGQELVACDEEPNRRLAGGYRAMRTARLWHKWVTRQVAYRLTFEDGREVICSGSHRWLSRKTQKQAAWRSIAGHKDPRALLKVGDTIRSVTEPWGSGDWEDGWYGGMADGEGSFDQTGTGVTLTVHQRDNPAWQRLHAYAVKRGYDFTHMVDTRGPAEDGRKGKLGATHIHSIAIARMDQMFRLIGQTRPARFLSIKWWEGRRMPDRRWVKIVKIEKLPEQELIDIETCTGTFIAEGMVSHNSTYIAGRYYWKAATRFGRKVYILSHEKKSSEALFTMVERFQRFNPFALKTGEDNAAKMTFPGVEGSYTVATAGAQEGGRGDDVNLFHGSEVAYWQNAESHFAASLQCVALLPGTEVVFESTSGGPQGKFHEQFQKGLKDEELYQSIFVPWYVSKEYHFPPEANFALDTTPPDDQNPSETDIATVHNLSMGQMKWRRLKVSELGLPRFNREYPTTVDDAWSSTDAEVFMKPASVVRARARDTEPSGPLVMGVDPAGGGGDRFAVCFRQGNKVTKLIWRNKINIIEATEWVLDLILTEKPARVNIDSGNIGQALITNLRARDRYCVEVIRSVAFGTPSQSKQASKARVGPENRRAEMWGRMRDWIEDQEGHADIPNIDDLSSDLLSPKIIWRTNGDWLLESKSDMKKRGVRSPDLGDSLALTFASREVLVDSPVAKPSVHAVAENVITNYEDSFEGSDLGWMA